MIFFHGSIWYLVASGLVGLYLGYRKGFPQWGLFLGMALGPIGWGVILILPSQRHLRFRRPAGSPGSGKSAEPAEPHGNGNPECPRCGKTAGSKDKACAHCGNLLIPIHYKII
ncbi:MAG: zinc ribbon domain-containing protein [Fibrobacterota bacterium]|nr:zinc ribbon domain-containing protein [Fibrobacterota bacterium]